jgi:predicted DNA-binding ribbon-helix-helix protein
LGKFKRVSTLLQETPVKSSVIKRSIVVAGHKTSVSLEDAFWAGLKEIARIQCKNLPELVAEIDARRSHTNLSSGIRLFVLEYYQSRNSATTDRTAATEKT